MSVYRDRFAATMAHQPVDRCPIDLAGTSLTTVLDERTISGLAEFLGLPGERPHDYAPFDRRILEAFDVDFRRTGGIVSCNTRYREQRSATEIVDCFGIVSRDAGLYWEMVDGPLWGADIDAVAAYEFPTPETIPLDMLDRWAAEARRLRAETPYVVVGEHPIFGVLELGCWLAGYEHMMLMLAAEPEWVHLLFGKILDFQKMLIREYYGRMGNAIHLTTSGDDFGTQHGLFISPPMWQAFVKPYFRERIAYTRQFTDAVFFHHSCGAIFEIIPDLIEIGVQVLNPIQPAAAGMAPERLKAAYGKEIVFHGGLDTQEVLPSNDPAHIAEAVRHLITAMHPTVDGGFTFAPAHNIQRDVEPEAVAAMYRAIRE